MKELYIITTRVDDDYKKVVVASDTFDKVKKLYPGQTVRIDHITELLKVTKETLSKLITINEKTRFPYGLLINEQYILSEELVLFSIIDYDNKTLDLGNLKKYFKSRNIESKINISSIYIFSTESMLLNEKIIPLNFHNGLHIQNRLHKDSIREAISNSATKLLNMSYSSGKFIYHINALTGEKSVNYNILRHAGSVWSIINAKDYINDPSLNEKLDKQINYLLDRYMYRTRNKAFLYRSEKKDGFSIGSCGLMLLVLTDYQLYFKDDKYLDLAKEFANGILSMQQPNGDFFQYYDNDLQLKSQFECEFYVGETTLALMKLYEITHNQKYLDSVLDNLEYCINTGFEKYHDHWIAYTLAEVSKYVRSERIIEFVIRNVTPMQRSRFNPTRLESNVQLYRFYHYMKQYEEYKELLEEFPIEQIESNVDYYLKSLMSYYIGKETAIFTKDIKKSINGFFCPMDDNRMRIDDIQHSIMGLMNYCKYCNKE